MLHCQCTCSAVIALILCWCWRWWGDQWCGRQRVNSSDHLRFKTKKKSSENCKQIFNWLSFDSIVFQCDAKSSLWRRIVSGERLFLQTAQFNHWARPSGGKSRQNWLPWFSKELIQWNSTTELSLHSVRRGQKRTKRREIIFFCSPKSQCC